MTIEQNIFKQLSEELSLPYIGIEQDWDLEMANSDRVEEFLEFYKRRALSDEEKIAVMSLILASYDDFLNKNDWVNDEKWEEIKGELKNDRELLVDLINYWSLDDNSAEECVFNITPLIREI